MHDAQAAGPFTPGAMFAGYRILGVLGRGGMGIVYRAEDTRLGRQVALKVLSPHIAGDPSFRQRFMREPRLLASVEHRNIVDVFHADQVDGVAFLAMRLIDGVDLGTILRDRGRLEPAEVSHIVTEVADALDAAHKLGLIHRDVKPGNILVAAKNGPIDRARVYLTDFGLTKRNDAPSELTSTGQFVGTVDYVAPEQIQGSAIDGRADLYALGCVAYECLGGRPPFHEARDAAALMAHLVTRPPDIRQLRPDLPPAVAGVLMRGMAKSRDERHATCADFSSALAEALSGGGSALPSRTEAAAPPPPPVAPPVVAPSTPPGPTWATNRTVAMPAPAAPARLAYPAGHAYGANYPDARGYAYDTDYGVARVGVRRRPRRRGLGGIVLAALALLVLASAAVALAMALGRPGTAAPGGGAARSASPGASLTTDVVGVHDRLRSHIPASLRSACAAGAAVEPVLAVQECSLVGGRITLVYSLFADTATMNAAYELVRRQLGVPVDSGRAGSRCTDAATWPNEGPYTRRDQPTGRLLCTFVAGETRFEWTDRRADVLTSATDTSGDSRRLYRLWFSGRLPPLATPMPELPASQAPEVPPTPTQAPSTAEPPTTPTEPPITDPPEPPATPAGS